MNFPYDMYVVMLVSGHLNAHISLDNFCIVMEKNYAAALKSKTDRRKRNTVKFMNFFFFSSVYEINV